MEPNDERGWVKALGDPPDPQQMDPISPVQPTKRSLLFAGLVLSTLVVAAVVGVVAWRGLRGDPFGSARSIPTGMDYVVNFDALALSDSERLQRFVDAFTAPAFQAGLIEQQPSDLVAAIDQGLIEETGLSLSDDILPWIGRSVSIAGTIPEFQDPFGEPSNLGISLLLSADVRDRAAAATFVAELRSLLEDDGVLIEDTTIGERSGYRIGAAGDEFAGALVLMDDTLLIGLLGDVTAGINARDSGRSMADDAMYLDAMTQLPADQMMSFFVSGRVLDSMAALGSAGLYGIEDEAPISQQINVSSFGGSIGLVDEGVLATYVAVGEEIAATTAGPDERVLAALPADTLGFMSIHSDADVAEPLDPSVFDDLGLPLGSFEDEFGIDVLAVLESLSGDFTAVVAETREGAIAQATDVPIGVAAALGLADAAPLGEAIDSLLQLIRGEGLEVVHNSGVNTVVGGDEELLSYALEDNLFVIGTGAGLVGDIATGEEGGVVDSDLYRDLDGAITGDGLVAYADVGRIVRLIPLTSDESAVLTPIRGLGIGVRVEGTVGVLEALLLVDY